MRILYLSTVSRILLLFFTRYIKVPPFARSNKWPREGLCLAEITQFLSPESLCQTLQLCARPLLLYLLGGGAGSM